MPESIIVAGRCAYCQSEAKWSRDWHHPACPTRHIASRRCPRCHGRKSVGFVYCLECARCPVHPSEDRFECPACESISETRADERALAKGGS